MIPLVSCNKLRGKPKGSHDSQGSLEFALYVPGLLSLNRASPAGVKEEGSPPLPLGPAHIPYRSRRGAGPPGPFFSNSSTCCTTCAARFGERASAAVPMTINLKNEFCIFRLRGTTYLHKHFDRPAGHHSTPCHQPARVC